jgi:predicted membrane protein
MFAWIGLSGPEGTLMSGRTIIGTLLILLGAGFLLGQMHVWDFGAILGTWWPLILIVIGAIQLATRSAPVVGAIIVIVIGLVFQALTLHLLPVNAWPLFWSALLVVVGLWLLVGRGFRMAEATSSAEVISVLALFGASNPRSMATTFRGGSVTTFFGGSEVDLRASKLAPDGARLEVTSVFGGATIKVPSDWPVEMTGLPLLGGWSNRAHPAEHDPGEPRLRVSCFVMFGGIDVTN